MREVKSRCQCTKSSDTPPPRICETIPRYDFEVVREEKERNRKRERSDKKGKTERERVVELLASPPLGNRRQ